MSEPGSSDRGTRALLVVGALGLAGGAVALVLLLRAPAPAPELPAAPAAAPAEAAPPSQPARPPAAPAPGAPETPDAATPPAPRAPPMTAEQRTMRERAVQLLGEGLTRLDQRISDAERAGDHERVRRLRLQRAESERLMLERKRELEEAPR